MNQQNKQTEFDAQSRGADLSAEKQQVGISFTREEVTDLIEKAKAEVLEEARKELAIQIQMDKVALMSIFGVFASVLSFLTIEFQFLRTIQPLEKILGFTLVLCALLLCFPLALDVLITSRVYSAHRGRPDSGNLRLWIYLGVIGLLFACGVAFTCLSK